MTEDLSPKASQEVKEESQNDLRDILDKLDDDFSDGELSMLISEPPVTPKILRKEEEDPMVPQNESSVALQAQKTNNLAKIKFPSFGKTSQAAPEISKSTLKRELYKTNPGEVAEDDFESLNRLYYMYLFPYKPFFHWLNYGKEVSRNFTHREFSFTIGDEIYMRYQSFENEMAFKDRLKRLCPVKIDIGAIYDIEPKKKASLVNPLVPQARELVFDIDLTDYDDVRTCCEKTTICYKCWGFMRLAMKIIHRALTEDFGFQHILWVFSGGRGIHAWVCDSRARELSNEGRRSIASYLDISRSGGPRRVMLGQTLHPSVENVMELVEETFVETVLKQQDLLNTSKAKCILESLPEDLRCEVQIEWEKKANYVSSQSRWEQLELLVEKHQRQAKGKKSPILNTLIRDLKLQCCFPRLDVHVSTAMNHLLKAPFCIHPRARKICVPISPREFDSFDPAEVPTDHALLTELANTSSQTYTAEKTSMWPYIQTFQTFVDSLLAAQPKRHIGSLDF